MPYDNILTSDGKLSRDATIGTRVRIRLGTKRGTYFADSEIGSRLHLISITKDANRRVVDAVSEALEPLRQEGSLISAEVTEVDVDHARGIIAFALQLVIPGRNRPLQLGPIEIGAA